MRFARDLRLAIKILMTRQQFFMAEEETEEVSLSRQDNTTIQLYWGIQQ